MNRPSSSMIFAPPTRSSAGWPEEKQRALPLVLVRREPAGRADQVRDVNVVAAGVHDARFAGFALDFHLRGIGQARLLRHRQGIQIGANHDGRPVAIFQHADNARLGDSFGHLDAGRPQLLRHAGGRLVFLERQLRMRVKMAIQLNQLRLMGFGPGCGVFGERLAPPNGIRMEARSRTIPRQKCCEFASPASHEEFVLQDVAIAEKVASIPEVIALIFIRPAPDVIPGAGQFFLPRMSRPPGRLPKESPTEARIADRQTAVSYAFFMHRKFDTRPLRGSTKADALHALALLGQFPARRGNSRGIQPQIGQQFRSFRRAR